MTRAVLTLAVAWLLGGCAVVAPERVVGNLEFELVAEGSGFRRLDLPGVAGGSPAATLRIRTRASNPNPVGVRLAGLDFDLYVNGTRAGSGSFTGGVDLPPRGQTVLDLEVTTSLEEGGRLVADLAEAARGQRTAYRLVGTVSLAAGRLGNPRFGPLTIVSGTLSSPLKVVFPTFRLDADGSKITELKLPDPVSGHPGLVRVRFLVLVENLGALGYSFTGTTLHLAIAGVDVARAGFPPGAGVRSYSTSTVEVVFDFPLRNLGLGVIGVFRSAARGEPVQAVVRGSLTLDSGSVGRFPLPDRELIRAWVTTR